MLKRRHEIRVAKGEIDAALNKARQFAPRDPRVVRAAYQASTDRLKLAFADGQVVLIPRAYLQGLEGANRTQISTIEIVGNGTGLHWPLLDVDHYVLGLLQGVWGTQRWMSEIGRKGGSAKSAAKADAARRNGSLGGRPRAVALQLRKR